MGHLPAGDQLNPGLPEWLPEVKDTGREGHETAYEMFKTIFEL